MREEEQVEKIHTLARKARLEGLSNAEREEQRQLRVAYLQCLLRFARLMDTRRDYVPDGTGHSASRLM